MTASLNYIPSPRRTEIEVAADATYALIAAGLIPRTVTVGRVATVVGVTVDDLRLASIRAGRVPADRLRPRAERDTRPDAPPAPTARAGRPPSTPVPPPSPRPPLPPEAYERQPIPTPGDKGRDRPKLTAAGRRGAAEAVFAEWKVRGHLSCTRCGKPMHSGTEVVVTAAHHAERCP